MLVPEATPKSSPRPSGAAEAWSGIVLTIPCPGAANARGWRWLKLLRVSGASTLITGTTWGLAAG